MNLKLDSPIRTLEIAHGYYTEARMRSRHPARLVYVADWHRGEQQLDVPEFLRLSEAEIAERYNADLPAGGP